MTDPTQKSPLPALINLLDEPDERAYGLIRERILQQGMEALGPLQQILDSTFDEVVRARTEEILGFLRQEDLREQFSDWMNVGTSDLLKGFILVSRTRFPELDEKEIMISVEQLKLDIWIELNDNLTALENVKVINHLLFEIHHFKANKEFLTEPENSYVNSLLESKKGSPLTLGMLYIILAQKLNLPVYGVNLPQHFILAYLTEPGIEDPGEESVLFYINPFNRGAVFTRREIELFITQLKIKPERSFFTPCSNQEIIRRLINNLVYLYNQAGTPDKAADLENLLTEFK